MKKEEKRKLAYYMINYATYILLILFVSLIAYVTYSKIQIATERLSLEWDENILALTWEKMIWSWQVEDIKQHTQKLKQQTTHSIDDIYQIAKNYSDIWKIWKWIVVLENYLKLWEGNIYENMHFHELLWMLYEEVCQEDKARYCENALEHFVKLYEWGISNEYLLNIANIVWRMWEDEVADKILEMYEDKEGEVSTEQETGEEIKIDEDAIDIQQEEIEIEN